MPEAGEEGGGGGGDDVLGRVPSVPLGYFVLPFLVSGDLVHFIL